MARFVFKPSLRTGSARGAGVTFRMMDLPDPDDAPGTPGWHESSADLARGLLVIEGAPEDPFDAWFMPG